MKTHYEVLGIAHTATLGDIKAAYHLRAKETHPDGRGGSDDAHREFLLVQEAFDVLSDPEARTHYDKTVSPASVSVIKVNNGTESKSLPLKLNDPKWATHDAAWARYHAERSGPKYRNYNIDPIEKPIQKLNEQSASKKLYVNIANPAGSDGKSTCEVFITLKQAFEGLTVYLRNACKVQCRHCDGKGYVIVAGPECRVCSGNGRTGAYGLIGRWLFGAQCGNCAGVGNIRVTANCKFCFGDGVETLYEERPIEIMRGVHDQDVLLLPAGRGDLRVKILPDERLVRTDDNLNITEYMTEAEARQGLCVDVPRLAGGSRSVFVKLDSGDTKKYVIPGLGMPRKGSTEFGDLVLTVAILKSRKQKNRLV